MSSILRPFSAFLPQSMEPNDKVILEGKIRDDAKTLSINFIQDCGPKPALVAYHFKSIFDTNTVVHNYKHYEWGEERSEPLTWCKGPGDHFNVEFIFQDFNIFVYTQTGFQYSFETPLDLSKIRTVEVWDDLDFIKSIKFAYDRNY